MLRILNRRGQSTIEYAAFLIIVTAALLSMQMYFKRGIQGRMKSSVDGVGEQYDPLTTEGEITQRVSGVTNTIIRVQDTTGGKETFRDDNSTITETKTGTTTVLAY